MMVGYVTICILKNIYVYDKRDESTKIINIYVYVRATSGTFKKNSE